MIVSNRCIAPALIDRQTISHKPHDHPGVHFIQITQNAVSGPVIHFSQFTLHDSPLSITLAWPLNTDNNIHSVFTVTAQAGQIVWYPIITDRYNVPHIMSGHIGICLAGVQLYTHTHTGCSVHWAMFLLKEYSTMAQTSVPLTWKNPTMVFVQATLHPPEHCGKCGHQEPARGFFL